MISRPIRQPQQALPIARSNPLAAGLVAAFYPQGTNAITQGTVRLLSGPRGVGFASTTNSRWQVSANAKVSLSPTWTILTILQGVESNTSLGGTALYTERPNGNQIVKLGVGDGNTNFATLVVRDASGSNLVLLRGVTDVRTMGTARVIVGVRRGPASHALYINGKPDATSTANASGVFNNTAAQIGGDAQDTDSALTGTASIPLVLLWARDLSDAEIASVSANPWQVLAPAQSRILVPGNITQAGNATVTGLSAVSAVGGISPSGTATTQINGVSASSSSGAITANGAASATLVGQFATAQTGQITTTASAAANLTGLAASAQVGQVAARGNAAAMANGVQSASNVGIISATAGGSASAIIIGVAAVSTVANLSASGSASADTLCTGALAIVGTISASAGGNGIALITGVISIASVGTLTSSGGTRAVLAGSGSVASIGAIVASGGAGAIATILGISARASVGTIAATGEVSPDGIARIFGVAAIAAVGTISAQGTRGGIDVSVTEDMICETVRRYILSIAPSLRVVRTPVNRASTPNGPYVSFTPGLRRPLSTNVSTTTDNSRMVRRDEQMTFQIDCFGEGSADLAETLNALYRDSYAVELFAESQFEIVPLYAGDVMQAPFVNDADQYEDRYLFQIELQINPVITVPQQSCNILGVELKSVDANYPPDEVE